MQKNIAQIRIHKRRLIRLISNSNKTDYCNEQSTKIDEILELLLLQERHLKVNSIRLSAEATFVITAF